MALDDLTTYFTCRRCNQKFELGLNKLLLEIDTVICPKCKGKALDSAPEAPKPLNYSIRSARTLCLAGDGVLPPYTMPVLEKHRMN